MWLKGSEKRESTADNDIKQHWGAGEWTVKACQKGHQVAKVWTAASWVMEEESLGKEGFQSLDLDGSVLNTSSCRKFQMKTVKGWLSSLTMPEQL